MKRKKDFKQTDETQNPILTNWVQKRNPREIEILSKLANPRGNAKKSQIPITCTSEIDHLNTTLYYSALIRRSD